MEYAKYALVAIVAALDIFSRILTIKKQLREEREALERKIQKSE
jgi:hypothetical protein